MFRPSRAIIAPSRAGRLIRAKKEERYVPFAIAGRDRGRAGTLEAGLPSALLPGQAVKAPAGELAALMALIERALEAFEDVVDLAESGLLQGEGRIDGALATATDDHHRPVQAGNLLHLADEMRVDRPVGSVVPGDMVGSDRVSYEGSGASRTLKARSRNSLMYASIMVSALCPRLFARRCLREAGLVRTRIGVCGFYVQARSRQS
jgi:hypothetical protein